MLLPTCAPLRGFTCKENNLSIMFAAYAANLPVFHFHVFVFLRQHTGSRQKLPGLDGLLELLDKEAGMLLRKEKENKT